jgi:hypothetical protein
MEQPTRSNQTVREQQAVQNSSKITCVWWKVLNNTVSEDDKRGQPRASTDGSAMLLRGAIEPGTQGDTQGGETGGETLPQETLAKHIRQCSGAGAARSRIPDPVSDPTFFFKKYDFLGPKLAF